MLLVFKVVFASLDKDVLTREDGWMRILWEVLEFLTENRPDWLP